MDMSWKLGIIMDVEGEDVFLFKLYKYDDGRFGLIFNIESDNLTGIGTIDVINEDGTTSRVEGRDVARRFLSLLRFYIRYTGAQSTANALTIEEVRDFL